MLRRVGLEQFDEQYLYKLSLNEVLQWKYCISSKQFNDFKISWKQFKTTKTAMASSSTAFGLTLTPKTSCIEGYVWYICFPNASGLLA